jgi:hypothetical protein
MRKAKKIWQKSKENAQSEQEQKKADPRESGGPVGGRASWCYQQQSDSNTTDTGEMMLANGSPSCGPLVASDRAVGFE